ncbi:MAG: phosphotransferase, partial [Candidatus Bathyarchaeota archaeon]|nr:phosphotransferase [Candidatus Bathyarchaeota archaeon]
MKKVMELLKEHFGIENATSKKVEGYGKNINFQVCTAQGEKFVYKQYQTELGLYELLDAENQALQKLLHQSTNSYPTPVRNLKGKFLSTIENGKQLIRMLTFVEGELLAEVKHSTDLFQSIGRFLAQMNKTLLDFYHPAIGARQLDWDLQHCLNNRKYIKYIGTPHQRKLVDYFFLQYSEIVLPEMPNLRRCVIHSDANDWNLLVRDDKISGIIDFGD